MNTWPRDPEYVEQSLRVDMLEIAEMRMSYIDLDMLKDFSGCHFGVHLCLGIVCQYNLLCSKSRSSYGLVY